MQSDDVVARQPRAGGNGTEKDTKSMLNVTNETELYVRRLREAANDQRLSSGLRDDLYDAAQLLKNLASTLTTTQASEIASLKEQVERMRAAFRTADRIACAAIENGFYVGDGLLEQLASARNALGDAGS